MENYGKYFKKHRLTRKLTLIQVEEATGISNQNLSRWENNKIIPGVDFCEKLANFYNITIDELIGRKKPY